MGYDVFVSYSSKQRKVADALVHALESARIGCWIAPRDIRVGEQYPEAIMRGLRETKLTLFIASTESMSSRWCCNEVTTTVSLNHAVVPCRIDDCELSDNVKLSLASSHWIDAFPCPEKYFEKIVGDVRVLLGREVDHPLRSSPAAMPAKRRSLWLAFAVIGGLGLGAWLWNCDWTVRTEGNRCSSKSIQAQNTDGSCSTVSGPVCGSAEHEGMRRECQNAQQNGDIGGNSSRTDDATLDTALAALPSIRGICRFSLVSQKGVEVNSSDATGDVGHFDYLLKVEIDCRMYFDKIAPSLKTLFSGAAEASPSLVRLRCESASEGVRCMGSDGAYRDYVSLKDALHHRAYFAASEGKADEAARLSATQLGDYRGRCPFARIGDDKRENLKAVVLTELTDPLTYAKGLLFELPPAVLDRIDAWKECQKSKLEFDVVLLDKSGKELAVSALTISADCLDYANYMSYFGKERCAFLVAPFVGGNSLAYYKWLRFNMSPKAASRVVSLKVE